MSQVHQLIAGIGINANQQLADFPEEVQQKAISLAVAAGHPVQRTSILCAVLQKIEENCLLLSGKALTPFGKNGCPYPA